MAVRYVEKQLEGGTAASPRSQPTSHTCLQDAGRCSQEVGCGREYQGKASCGTPLGRRGSPACDSRGSITSSLAALLEARDPSAGVCVLLLSSSTPRQASAGESSSTLIVEYALGTMRGDTTRWWLWWLWRLLLRAAGLVLVFAGLVLVFVVCTEPWAFLSPLGVSFVSLETRGEVSREGGVDKKRGEARGGRGEGMRGGEGCNE